MPGTRAYELSTWPTAIRDAVSMQRQMSEDTIRSTRTPWLRKALPSATPCARPFSSRFRCVPQSSNLNPRGSPPKPRGALPWRISATWPPLTRASQASSAAKEGGNVKSSDLAFSDVAQPPTTINNERATPPMTTNPIRRMGHLGGGWLAGSLADDGGSQEAAALVIIVGAPVDRGAARTRHPDAVALDGRIKFAAALVLQI